MIKTTRYAISTLATFLGLLAGNADGAKSNEGRLSVSTGFDYSSGKYGTSSSTDILYIPVSAKYETDSARFKWLYASRDRPYPRPALCDGEPSDQGGGR